MRGKIIFVVGLATGYVLGTRAGRERYEQIKAGAEKVWNTPAVQSGVDKVQEFAGARVDSVKADLSAKAHGALSALIGREPRTSSSTTASTAAAKVGSTRATPTKTAAAKPSAAKPTAAKASAAKKPATEPAADTDADE
jgi:hypothetical protein